MPLTWHTIDLRGVDAPRLWELADAAAAAWRRARAADGAARREREAAAAGRLLFQAARLTGDGVFDPRTAGDPEPLPPPAVPEQPLPGYHLVLPPSLLELPWVWLHNGMEFLVERAAVSAGPDPLGAGPVPAAWRHRRRDLRWLAAAGMDPAAALADHRRRAPAAPADILALAADPHDPRTERELAALADALAVPAGGRHLARLRPAPAGLPALAVGRCLGRYHGVHYAGAAAGAAAAVTVSLPPPADSDRDAVPAGGGGVTGLPDDPDTAGGVGAAAAGRRAVPRPHPGWELPDGYLSPERLPPGPRPPLVTASGGGGLADLGPRWLAAGAHVVAAPQWPVPAATAARFTALFYRALAGGAVAALAWRHAVLALRAAGDPHWPAPGLLGDGAFSLLYL